MDDLCNTNIENLTRGTAQVVFENHWLCASEKDRYDTPSAVESLNSGRISETQTAGGSVNAAEVFPEEMGKAIDSGS